MTIKQVRRSYGHGKRETTRLANPTYKVHVIDANASVYEPLWFSTPITVNLISKKPMKVSEYIKFSRSAKGRKKNLLWYKIIGVIQMPTGSLKYILMSCAEIEKPISK